MTHETGGFFGNSTTYEYNHANRDKRWERVKKRTRLREILLTSKHDRQTIRR